MNPTKRKKMARLRRLREESQPVVAEETVEEPVAGLRYPEPEAEPKAEPKAKTVVKKKPAKKKSVVKKITEVFDKE